MHGFMVLHARAGSLLYSHRFSPHYGLDAELRELLPALGECLRRPGAEPAKARVRWIREST